MTSHRRLQNYDKHYCMACITGFTGCRWKRYQQSTGPSKWCDLLWFWLLIGTSAYILFWFYYWLLAENSMGDINWYAYQSLGQVMPVYTILFVLTCITFSYICIVFILALCHIARGHQVYIHWSHRVVMSIVFGLCITATVLINAIWKDGWKLQKMSLMITGPFLHIGFVTLMTSLSWFIIVWLIPGTDDNFYAQHRRGLNVFILYMFCYAVLGAAVRLILGSVYIGVMIGLYLAPAFVHSPCIGKDLPSRPRLVAHKGAAAIAPENTVVAFEYATHYNIVAIESDVSVSFDGVPFILHDSTLKRTTNVKEIFPDQANYPACWFNISQLKRLDAGSWFIKDKPFGDLSGSFALTPERNALFRNQTIPTLTELLHIAQEANLPVMFDIKILDSPGHCAGHPYEGNYTDVIIQTINDSGFPAHMMWWLYYKKSNSNLSSTNASHDTNNGLGTIRIEPKTTTIPTTSSPLMNTFNTIMTSSSNSISVNDLAENSNGDGTVIDTPVAPDSSSTYTSQDLNYTRVNADPTISAAELSRMGFSIVNFAFYDISLARVSQYNEYNISVNLFVVDSPWLYSLDWCMGVQSTTTNKCHYLSALTHPVWFLSEAEFLALWMTFDILSLIAIAVMCTVRLKNHHHTTFQVETISLGSTVGGRAKITHSPNTMKRKLLQAMDSTGGGGGAIPHPEEFDSSPPHHHRRHSSNDRGIPDSPDFTDIFQPEEPGSREERRSVSGSCRKSSNSSGKFAVSSGRSRVTAEVVVVNL